MNQSGECLCGAVEFAAGFASANITACHCDMCQRWSSAPYMSAHSKTFEITKGADQVIRYRSSDWAERGFCGHCGTHLFYHLLPAKAHMVAVGCLKDQDMLRFTKQIFVDQKSPAYAFENKTEMLTKADVMARVGGSDS